MKKIVFLSLFPMFLTLTVFSQTVTIGELLKAPGDYDGKEVQVSGEAIGEAIYVGPEQTWVNISDNGEGLGVVFENRDLIKDIKFWGAYNQIGDTIEVNGEFHSDCAIHQSSDIHGQQVKILQNGRAVAEDVEQEKVQFFKVLAVVWLLIVIIYFIRVKKHR